MKRYTLDDFSNKHKEGVIFLPVMLNILVEIYQELYDKKYHSPLVEMTIYDDVKLDEIEKLFKKITE